MLSLLIWLIIVCAVLGIAWWIISQIPMPAPMNIVVRVVFGLIVLVLLLYLANSVIGHPHMGHLSG